MQVGYNHMAGGEDGSIVVRVFKYDGTEYRRWTARVAKWEESLIVLDAVFEYNVKHEVLGEIPRGTRTVEYYWFNRWYNIFQFLEDDASTRLWYCNINTPPTLEGGLLSYIDLDIDVLVQPDFTFAVLDLEEFEQNAKLFSYDEQVRREVKRALDEVISLIEARQFPFTDT